MTKKPIEKTRANCDEDIKEELDDYLAFMFDPHTMRDREKVRERTVKVIKALVIQTLMENGSRIDSESILEIGDPQELG